MARSIIDPAHLLEEQLAQASRDLLRELLGTLDVAVPKLRTGSYFPSGCWNVASAPNGR